MITAPEVFDFDPESGQALVLHDEVPADQHDAALRAVAGCPVQAIVVEDG